MPAHAQKNASVAKMLITTICRCSMPVILAIGEIDKNTETVMIAGNTCTIKCR